MVSTDLEKFARKTKFKLMSQREKADTRRLENESIAYERELVPVEDRQKVNAIREMLQILSSHFWSKCYQTPSQMLGVKGLTKQANENIKLFEEATLRILHHCDFAIKSDTAMSKHNLVYGFYCYNIKWLNNNAFIKTQENIASYKTDIEKASNEVDIYNDETALSNYENVIKNKAIELAESDLDGVVFDPINLENFWYDTEDETKNPTTMLFRNINVKDNFLEELNIPEDEFSKTKNGTDSDVYDNNDFYFIMGDFFINNKLLKNHYLVLNKDDKLVFDKPLPITGNLGKFIYGEMYPSLDRYGYGPVDFAMELQHTVNALMENGLQNIDTNSEPPVIMPEGTSVKGYTSRKKGDILFYKKAENADNYIPPIPITSNSSESLNYMPVVLQLIESVTGATRQLSGLTGPNDPQQTATEFSGLMSMGNLVLQRLIDRYNQYTKPKTIQAIIRMFATYADVPVRVSFENELGETIFESVTSKVLLDSYQYEIIDEKEITSKHQQGDRLLQSLAMLPQLLGDDVKRFDFMSAIKTVIYQYYRLDLKYLEKDELIKKETEKQEVLQQLNMVVNPPPALGSQSVVIGLDEEAKQYILNRKAQQAQ